MVCKNALDLKAPKESPAFAGTVSGISKGLVGLGNVDNTADQYKPLADATVGMFTVVADVSFDRKLALKADKSDSYLLAP